MTAGAIVLVWAASIAQVAQDSAEPYEFFLGNGSTPMYVRVDPRELERPTGRIQVELDEPWLPASERFQTIRLSDITQSEEQRSTLRKARIEKGWREHGGIQIETAGGQRWILREEYELAQRARSMAEALDETEKVAAAAETSEATDSSTGDGGGVLQWWRHVLIAAVAVALSGLVAKRFFFW